MDMIRECFSGIWTESFQNLKKWMVGAALACLTTTLLWLLTHEWPLYLEDHILTSRLGKKRTGREGIPASRVDYRVPQNGNSQQNQLLESLLTRLQRLPDFPWGSCWNELNCQ